MMTVLCFKSLHHSVTESDLRALLRGQGHIRLLKLNNTEHLAHVLFDTELASGELLTGLNEGQLAGKKLSVHTADSNLLVPMLLAS